MSEHGDEMRDQWEPPHWHAHVVVVSNAVLAALFGVVCFWRVDEDATTGIVFALLALAAANGARLQHLALGREGFLGIFRGPAPRVRADIEGAEQLLGGRVTVLSPRGSRTEQLPSRPPDPEPDPTV